MKNKNMIFATWDTILVFFKRKNKEKKLIGQL